MIKDENIVIVSGDKDSSVVVMNKADYVMKLQNMIEEGILKGVYEETEDTTLDDLRLFKDFLRRHFQNYEKYDKMTPDSNQPGRIYGTAKTHKFDSVEDINLQDLKFRPIIAQTGTYTYKTAQVIGEYLKPLCSKNDFIIRNTQDFADILKAQPQLQEDEEYVSYDVESLFTNIPIEETINYIIKQIYQEHKLPKLCSKLVFKRLMYKLTTENTFIFQNKFYKQTDGCTMGGPLSVIMSDIFMTKLENDVVRPFNPPFYKRFVDDCITKRKRNEHDKLFELINNYHRNIKFTIEIQPTKFLDTKLINENGSYSTEVHRKETKLPVNWSSKTPKRYKRNAINGDLYRSYRISSNFNKEIELIRKLFTHADYPIRFTNSVIKQFQQRNALQQEEDDMIISPNLFE